MTPPNVNVIVTGLDWMGGGFGSIETAIQDLFAEAKYEILLTVYSITGGADKLFDWLDLALSRGVEVKMIINRLDKQTEFVRKRLKSLKKVYPHFCLCDFVDDDMVELHAKLIVVDRQRAIVGSSNLSRRGFLTNYELALRVEGQPATEVATVVDRLLARLM